jgi:hypothetical protein
MPERSCESPPTIAELVEGLRQAETALTRLLELLITSRNALAVMIDQGGLIAHLAEARRDARTALARLEDDL